MYAGLVWRVQLPGWGLGWSEVPWQKDPSRKALSDACDFRVQVGMVKILFVFSGLVRCEECDYKFGMWDCLKHHK